MRGLAVCIVFYTAKYMTDPPGLTSVTSHQSGTSRTITRVWRIYVFIVGLLKHYLALTTSSLSLSTRETGSLPFDLLTNVYDCHVSTCTITSLNLESSVNIRGVHVATAVRSRNFCQSALRTIPIRGGTYAITAHIAGDQTVTLPTSGSLQPIVRLMGQVHGLGSAKLTYPP
jgi:hypothetical protein